MTRRDRLVLWLAARIPAPLLAEPERFFLATACLLIGVDAALAHTGGRVLGRDTPLIAVEFGVCFIAGGMLTLAGLWRHRVWVERAGQALTALGCAIFLFGVIFFVGLSATAPTLVYVGIAVAYGLRLLNTAAARVRLYGGIRDRDAQ